MRAFLTKSSTLWILFMLFVLETIAFGVIMYIWDFHVIDEMSNPDAIRQHIEEMSTLQRQVHAWTTATLDVAYPLTYGPLFAGLALRSLRPLYALPAVTVIPVDLIEGAVQVLALTGTQDLIWLKAYVTPTKLVLFIAAMAIAGIALFLHIRRRKTDT